MLCLYIDLELMLYLYIDLELMLYLYIYRSRVNAIPIIINYIDLELMLAIPN